MRIHWCRGRGTLVVCLVLATTFVGGGGMTAFATKISPPQINVLSNRADLVSGGDALVEVTVADGAEVDDIRVELDGRDITHEFAVRGGGRYLGLVTGLRNGDNQLTARVAPNAGATLTITNHSEQGPIFAGAQVQPWLCQTQDYGLGPATGPACVAPTRYDYFYKSTVTDRFETYDPASPPADALIKRTTTDQGKTVPYVVRRERGVIDRGIYDIATLYQPGENWEPWAPQTQWNGKLHWLFEGDCNPGHRQAGGTASSASGPSDVLNGRHVADLPLSRGFAVGSSSLSRLGANCNDVVSAEAVMMIKEHFIETYGPVRYTTSDGRSGGAMQQQLIVANYPGLLDGIMPALSFPDFWTLASHDAADCTQLYRYFNETSAQLWTDVADRAAVSGAFADASCAEWGSAAVTLPEAFFDPGVGCATNADDRNRPTSANEPEWVYDAQTNPDGVRCTVQDYQAAVFGHRDTDGFANRPYDNVGVQYGLTALRRGQITAEQFVDLNVKIGGRDIDYNWTPGRSDADTEALHHLYRSGRVNDGRQLATVPIMDVRGGLNAEVHTSLYTQVMRARLIAANGHADNQVAWTSAAHSYPSNDLEMTKAAFTTLDEWLAAIEGDTSGDSLETKVVRHKPTQAKDTCWVAGQPGTCGDSLPNYANPRMVAGSPLVNDVFKCQLKPIDWDDYSPVQFTETQQRELQGAFPGGVCDWTQSGVEQQRPTGEWQTFADTIGGRPLGPAPQSTPLQGN